MWTVEAVLKWAMGMAASNVCRVLWNPNLFYRPYAHPMDPQVHDDM